MKICRIFAGGEIKDPSFIKIGAEDFIICADRGYSHARALGIVPDIIVGDFDSYTDKLPENIEIHRSIPEKDDTDAMLAVKLAIENGAEKILLYGALGGRFDHTVANIQTLTYIHNQGCEGIIEDYDNIITVQGEGEYCYPVMEGWYFSLFALTDKLHINQLSGVKYPLSDYLLTNGFPLGVSNEITSSEAVLKIKSGLALIVRSKM